MIPNASLCACIDKQSRNRYVHNPLHFASSRIMHPPNVSAIKLIAPDTILGRSQLIHLGNALFEFLVLALFVAMSLVLWRCDINQCASSKATMNMAEGRSAYLALPRKVVFGLSASVQWDQEVCTRVTVCQRETSIRHFLPGGSCT